MDQLAEQYQGRLRLVDSDLDGVRSYRAAREGSEKTVDTVRQVLKRLASQKLLASFFHHPARMMSRKYLHTSPGCHSEPKAKNLAAAIFAAVMVLPRTVRQITRQMNAARDGRKAAALNVVKGLDLRAPSLALRMAQKRAPLRHGSRCDPAQDDRALCVRLSMGHNTS